jgi:flagellar biosynthesis protein FlhG
VNTQADALRSRMRAVAEAPSTVGAGAANASDASAQSLQAKLARTVAVGSGKGGVGKSTCALALAWAAAERGVKTALIDADLGLANQDILCGVQPVRTAADWLSGRAQLSQCFMRLAPRLWLLPGASGMARLADLQVPQRERMIQGLARVSAHVELMVVDLGAGLGAGTLDVAAAADHLLVIATPEPTSVSDAYGFVKSCAKRGRTERVMLAMNMTYNRSHAELSAARLRATCARFVGVDVECVGYVPADDAVRHAVQQRTPLLSQASRSPAARELRRLEGVVSAQAGVGALSAPSTAPGFLTRLARSWGLLLETSTRQHSAAPTGGSSGGFDTPSRGVVRQNSGLLGQCPRIVPAQ